MTTPDTTLVHYVRVVVDQRGAEVARFSDRTTVSTDEVDAWIDRLDSTPFPAPGAPEEDC